LAKKYNTELTLDDIMKQEHVIIQNVYQILLVYDLIKKYLQNLKLEIIHEEKYENFWSIKAYKGGPGSMIIGNIREAEVMMSGSNGNYDLILRTGAWGRNILIPGAIASIATGGVGAAVGGISAYRAHAFEKNFWEYLTKMISDIGKGKATVSSPETQGSESSVLLERPSIDMLAIDIASNEKLERTLLEKYGVNDSDALFNKILEEGLLADKSYDDPDFKAITKLRQYKKGRSDTLTDADFKEFYQKIVS
jgi:hypothetical protein